MAETSGVVIANGCSIRVGTTGTISSLMTRELESIKHMQEASTSSSKKCQAAPVSVPCGATSRTLQPRLDPLTQVGSSSSNCHIKSNNKNSSGSICKIPIDAQNQRQPSLKGSRHENETLYTENTTADRKKMKGKPDKKRSSYIVEVVDLKCNNPMSSRLKKLGFSRLSESVV